MKIPWENSSPLESQKEGLTKLSIDIVGTKSGGGQSQQKGVYHLCAGHNRGLGSGSKKGSYCRKKEIGNPRVEQQEGRVERLKRPEDKIG